jgi:hypothetical protein
MWADAGMALRQNHSRHNAVTALCHADRWRALVSFSAAAKALWAFIPGSVFGLTTVSEARTRLCAPTFDSVSILSLSLEKTHKLCHMPLLLTIYTYNMF